MVFPIVRSNRWISVIGINILLGEEDHHLNTYRILAHGPLLRSRNQVISLIPRREMKILRKSVILNGALVIRDECKSLLYYVANTLLKKDLY